MLVTMFVVMFFSWLSHINNEVSALLANNAVITRLEVGMTKVTIEINNRTYVY